MTVLDIILLSAVALAAFAAVRFLMAQRKRGGCVGCSGCSSCGSACGSCTACRTDGKH